MATKAQLVREILKELGVFQAGQDLPPEDYRVVEERIPFEVAALHSADIYSLDDVDEIPDDALVELSKYLAGQYAAMFGLSGEELSLVRQSQAASERALRYLRTRGPTYARQRAEYF